MVSFQSGGIKDAKTPQSRLGNTRGALNIRRRAIATDKGI